VLSRGVDNKDQPIEVQQCVDRSVGRVPTATLGTILGARGTAPDDAHLSAAGSGIVYGVKPFVYDRIDNRPTDFRTPPATPVPSGAVVATPAPGAGVLGGAGAPGEPESPDDADVGDEGGDSDE